MNAKITVLVALTASVLGRNGFGPTDQEWGYVDVRPGAHLFWWLHKTAATNILTYTDRPLIIWLQGGPGASGTGMGNFEEIGPLDTNLNPRNTTWVNDYNVLFVDNPVGCGFSFVDADDYLVTSSKEQAQDFLVFLREFFKTLPEFQTVPLYIFGESYGGKYAVEIALVLSEAIKDKSLKANFKGIGLGDALISQSDSIGAFAPLLLSLGTVDQQGYELIKNASENAQKAIDAKDWVKAQKLVSETYRLTDSQTDFINLYNTLKKVQARNLPDKMSSDFIKKSSQLEVLMNENVKKALGLNSTWSRLSNKVRNVLNYETVMPVTEIVEQLLNTTDIKIAVYNGQQDLIISTQGTMKWVDKLNFKSNWKNAPRKSLVVNGVIEGYFKESGKLAFYSVYRAGHMVPMDNPEAMRIILKKVTNDFLYT